MRTSDQILGVKKVGTSKQLGPSASEGILGSKRSSTPASEMPCSTIHRRVVSTTGSRSAASIRRWLRLPACSGLVAIVYGRKGNNERFDPTYEKCLKARQAEKKSTGEASSEQAKGQSFDMSAPVSRKEAKKRRKATSPEKGAGPSARGRRAFLEMRLSGESASEQA